MENAPTVSSVETSCGAALWPEALGHLAREEVSSIVRATVQTVAQTMCKRIPSAVNKIKQLLKDKPEDFPAGPVAETSHRQY